MAGSDRLLYYCLLTSFSADIILIPVRVPDGYPELNFKPVMLRTTTLVAMLFFNILCFVGILLIIYEANAYGQYYSLYSNMRFVVRYVPTIVGTITTVLFRSMRDTMARIQPYISMASHPRDEGSRGSKSLGMLYTSELFWGQAKRRFHPRHQDWLRWAMFFGSILTFQISGYKAALFTASSNPNGTWVLTVHNYIAFVLLALYAVVITLTSMTLIKMVTHKTGLKWDPITIADQLALFHGSNTLQEFRALEQLHRQNSFDLLADKSFRLGYWTRVGGHRTTTWYGIGKLDLSQRKLSLICGLLFPSAASMLFPDGNVCSYRLSVSHNQRHLYLDLA